MHARINLHVTKLAIQEKFEKRAEIMRLDDAAIAAGDTRFAARKAHNDAMVSHWKRRLKMLERLVRLKGKKVNILKKRYLKSSELERDLVRRGWGVPERSSDEGDDFLSMKMPSCVIQ